MECRAGQSSESLQRAGTAVWLLPSVLVQRWYISGAPRASRYLQSQVVPKVDVFLVLFTSFGLCTCIPMLKDERDPQRQA